MLSAHVVTKTFGGGSWLRREPGVAALKGVSIDVAQGETVGIVGESGSGKSTLARILTGLERPDGGEVRLHGERLNLARTAGIRTLRRDVQMMLQDSSGTLNPRLSLRQTVAFGPWARGEGRREAFRIADEVLERVGLPAATFGARRPHQLSGGQRQRANLARTLALRPRLVILDEPVSALDKSMEAQVLNLLVDLRRDLDLTMVLISHDLIVVRHLCPRMIVMRDGEVVEDGATKSVFERPAHLYTRALIAAIPRPVFARAEEDAA